MQQRTLSGPKGFFSSPAAIPRRPDAAAAHTGTPGPDRASAGRCGGAARFKGDEAHLIAVKSLECRLAAAAQLGAVAVLGWRFAAHLPSAWLLQTLAFVALNKVRFSPGLFKLFQVFPGLFRSFRNEKRGFDVRHAFAAPAAFPVVGTLVLVRLVCPCQHVSTQGNQCRTGARHLEIHEKAPHSRKLPEWCPLTTKSQVVTAQYFVWYFSLAPLVLRILRTGRSLLNNSSRVGSALPQVVTAQYFVWYFSLAPLVLHSLRPASRVRPPTARTAWSFSFPADDNTDLGVEG